jgi:hypothetical protein
MGDIREINRQIQDFMNDKLDLSDDQLDLLFNAPTRIDLQGCLEDNPFVLTQPSQSLLGSFPKIDSAEIAFSVNTVLALPEGDPLREAHEIKLQGIALHVDTGIQDLHAAIHSGILPAETVYDWTRRDKPPIDQRDISPDLGFHIVLPDIQK